LRKLRSTVREINRLEEEYQQLSETQLQAKTAEFKARAAAGESLESLLPEAFATVKNACRRLEGRSIKVSDLDLYWDMIPYDVQLYAGIVLHEHGIAEMATGEGKTLAAAMPLYLNALAGNGVHLVTVNDYLARRDSDWIGEIFRYLGLTVGCIQTGQNPAERRQAYQCDITYGTNSEFGFDYLRDNGMAQSLDQMVQRELFYAIIDEIDSVLIDEARTPLIIAGAREIPHNQYDSKLADVRKLIDLQRRSASKILSETEPMLRDRFESEECLKKLLLVRLGMPLHPQLRKILENSQIREKLDRFEEKMLATTAASELSLLKNHLYFIVDEKRRMVEVTDRGHEYLSQNHKNFFILPDKKECLKAIESDPTLAEADKRNKIKEFNSKYLQQIDDIHSFTQLMQAYCLFEKDIHYVVAEGKILIVDEHTGRAMPGRRFSNGLHQALEAKENVKIEPEDMTYASITQQNYFRLYQKLAGMTGTAATEAPEFAKIYKLDVTQIPTNKPVNRVKNFDLVFKTKREKLNAIADDVADRHQKGQPVLLGTPSVEDSEMLSRILKLKKVPHQLLNAKQNKEEALIISRAGQKETVTIATNMAGRGTDIKLGTGVAGLGGLYVIGSSRHDARRIDLQLEGRSSRQGDPGESQFYVSLEDEFMRLFGPETVVKIFAKVAPSYGEALSHEQLDRFIQNAQKKLELKHFSMRKHTLDYDDVMNIQRKVIYALRRRILEGDETRVLDEMLARRARALVNLAAAPRQLEGAVDYSFDRKLLHDTLLEETGIDLTLDEQMPTRRDKDREQLIQKIAALLDEGARQKIAHLDQKFQSAALRYLLLNALDRKWVDHLNAMEYLTDQVYLVSYAQRDPLVEYKKEAYQQFEQLLENIADQLVGNFFRQELTV